MRRHISELSCARAAKRYDNAMSTQRQIIVAADDADLVRCAAQVMVDKAQAAIAAHGRFTVALSGGSTVRPIYELFSAAEDIDWARVFVFWGDDRFVETSNPYSNFRLAHEALLSRAPIPVANIFGVPTGERTPTAGAAKYSDTIRDFFGIAQGDVPRFDLVQQGMGPDGHTASLFPHSAALSKRGIAVMNHAGLAPWVDRVTFTMATINAAACVLFVAKGGDKADMLKQVLEGEPNIKHWPSSAVHPADGELIWVIEPGIARLLGQPIPRLTPPPRT